MNSTLRTDFQYILAHYEYIKSQLHPEELVDEAVSHDSIVQVKLMKIDEAFCRVAICLNSSKSIDRLSQKVIELWNTLQIMDNWHRFSTSLREAIKNKKVISRTLCQESELLSEMIRQIFNAAITPPSVDISNEDGQSLNQFWLYDTCIEKYIKHRIDQLHAQYDTLLKSSISRTSDSTHWRQLKICEVERELDGIAAIKTKVLIDLFPFIVRMAIRVLNGDYGKKMQGELFSMSEVLFTFEPFMKLLLIDILSHNSLEAIQALSLFKDLTITDKEITLAVNSMSEGYHEIEKFVIVGEQNALSSL